MKRIYSAHRAIIMKMIEYQRVMLWHSRCNISISMKGHKGFSLVELLVVVAIMAVTAAIAIPTMMATTFPHAKLKSASREIYSALQLARSQAIGSTSDYGVRFNLSASPAKYMVMKWTGSAWTQDTTFAERAVDSQVNINDITVDGTNYTSGTTGVIRFDTTGTASSATIHLSSAKDTSDKFTVSVTSSTGRTQIITGW